jgi:TrmH family RNA methyltransferase
MEFKDIKSSQNDLVKLASSLKLKKYRKQKSLFLAEGARTVKEFIQAGFVKYLLLDSTKKKYFLENEMFRSFFHKNFNIVYLLDSPVYKKVSTTEFSQGIIALCELPDYEMLPEEISTYSPSSSFLPVLDNLSDPGNCGTIIRLAAGMDFRDILFLGSSADPFNPKVVRSSAGASASINIKHTEFSIEIMKQLKNIGYRILITDAEGKSNLRNYPFPSKCCLIFGEEAHGVSEDIHKIADDIISINISGNVESFNVATCAAIFFYEYRSFISG